jgi:hypothetical protein
MKNALLLVLVGACASDPDPVPPTIANLSYSPLSLPVGQQGTVNGTLTFDDPDGDLAQLAVEVTLPDHSRQTLPMSNLQNVGAMTEGTIAWALIVVPPTAGRYDFSLWITDAAMNVSNKLDGSVMAQ